MFSSVPALIPGAVDGQPTLRRRRRDRLRHTGTPRWRSGPPRLAGDKSQLREHLDIAAAHIARLTLDNHRLTRELQAVTGVARLSRPNRTH